jgi:uncharacterized protein YkwD
VRLGLLVICIAVGAVAVIGLWPRSEAGAPADPCGRTQARPSEIGLEAAGQATVCLINRERTSRGLPPFRVNPLLSSTSAQHSVEMVREDYFEHDTPDGHSVGDRLRAAGYARGTNASAGENIAYGVGDMGTPGSIVSAWMHSPEHRADILRPAFTEIGIGIALGAPEVDARYKAAGATYTTDFGGAVDPSLPNG